ncbi:MAG: DUF4190 domain-containing protein [Leifsonia sp.]
MSTTLAASPALDGTGPIASTADRSLSITSLVLGIVSIVAGWTFLAPVAGLVLGIIGLRREPAGRTFAIWGIVLSSVMLAGTVLVTAAALLFGLALLPFAFLGS